MKNSGRDINYSGNQGRDISPLSRHQLTKNSGRDISRCRDITYKKIRSRHDLVVATSVTKGERSRHPLHRPESRDIKYKELRSRHDSVVATSDTSKEGRDIIK